MTEDGKAFRAAGAAPWRGRRTAGPAIAGGRAEAGRVRARIGVGGLPFRFPYPLYMRDIELSSDQGPAPAGTETGPYAAPVEPIPPAPRWTDEEDAVLQEWYGQLSVRELRQRFLPQRSVAGICARAERLELTGATRNAWTAPELASLKKFYGRVPITELLRDHLPGRSASAVHTRAHALGLSNKASAHWAPWEVEVLIAHYADTKVRALQARYLPHRTLAAIVTHARLKGLSEPASAPWTADEDQILRTHYRSLSVPKIRACYLPHRTREAVRGRADVLGLRKFPRIGPWSEEQLALLREEFPKPGGVVRLCEHFRCSGNTIRSKAKALGLSGPRGRRWSDKELAALCGIDRDLEAGDASIGERELLPVGAESVDRIAECVG